MIKKIFIIVFAFSFCFLGGCAKKSVLLSSISELRLNVYEGSSENYSVKATFGYCENVKNYDGKVSDVTYKLTIILNDYDSDGKISATLRLNGQDYTERFNYNPAISKMTAEFPVDDEPSTFDLIISANGNSQTVTLKSIVPDNTISYATALKNFEKQQPALIENYLYNGVFKGEIAMRIIVRDGAPYWYLGLTDEYGKTKALLIDGVSAEVLAIKDIF